MHIFFPFLLGFLWAISSLAVNDNDEEGNSSPSISVDEATISKNELDESELAKEVESLYENLILPTDKVKVKAFFTPPLSEGGASISDSQGHRHHQSSSSTSDTIGGDTLYFGEENEMLIQVRNGWTKPITIFSLSGSYRQPGNLQQVTESRLLTDIPPGQTATLSYMLKPDLLQAQIGFHLQVDFTDPDKKQWYKQTAFSRIVRIIEPPPTPISMTSLLKDWQLLGIFISIGIVLAVLSGLLLSSKRGFPFKYSAGGHLRKASLQKRSDIDQEPEEDEWIPAHLKRRIRH